MTVTERRELGAKRAAKRFYILAALDAKGYSPAKLAQEMGLSYVSVYKVLTGQSHSKRILQKMREIGVPEKLLFDPYYQAELAA